MIEGHKMFSAESGSTQNRNGLSYVVASDILKRNSGRCKLYVGP